MSKEKFTLEEFHKEMAASGGKARAEGMSPAGRSAAARNAVAERWKRYYKKHPKARIARAKKRRKNNGH